MTKSPRPERAPSAAEARAEVEARVAANRAAHREALDRHFGGAVPGGGLIVADAVVTVVFSALAVVGAAAGGGLADAAGNLSLAVGALGTVVFLVALWEGAQRSRTATMGIGGWFFLSGSAPGPVRWQLLGALAVQTVVGIATAWATFDVRAAEPTPLAFATLVPIFGLAVCGLWGARHGYFPPRDGGSQR